MALDYSVEKSLQVVYNDFGSVKDFGSAAISALNVSRSLHCCAPEELSKCQSLEDWEYPRSRQERPFLHTSLRGRKHLPAARSYSLLA